MRVHLLTADRPRDPARVEVEPGPDAERLAEIVASTPGAQAYVPLADVNEMHRAKTNGVVKAAPEEQTGVVTPPG